MGIVFVRLLIGYGDNLCKIIMAFCGVHAWKLSKGERRDRRRSLVSLRRLCSEDHLTKTHGWHLDADICFR